MNATSLRGFMPVKGAPEDTVLPTRKTKNSAGYDIVCPYDVRIEGKCFGVIPTNIKAWMPADEYLAIYARSSLFKKKHLMLANSVGIVDSDYFGNEDNDGNIGIAVVNVSSETVTISKGEAIAQGIFTKYYTVSDDDATGSRTGGFGSTDREGATNV